MSLIVMKFGGTSVGDAECIRRAAQLTQQARERHRVVVVVSAMAGVTDRVAAALQAAKSGECGEVEAICEALRARHAETLAALLPGHPDLAAVVSGAFDRLADICSGVAKVETLPHQISDMAMSLGEEISAQILAAFLQARGVPATYVDSSQCVITDAKFGEATPDFEATCHAARKQLLPLIDCQHIPVVTGYRGATASGQLTTLGRGGSDYSATLLGAALGADEVWIWTDVDGVLSGDPRICRDALNLDEITFREAVAFSHYGAKVIHHRAIQPARAAAIPVWIRNSFRPEAAGTRIAPCMSPHSSPVRAVTAVEHAALISINVGPEVAPAELFGRLLMRLSAEHVELLFSTQSSPQSLLLAVREQDERHVTDAVRRLFRSELRHGLVEPVEVEHNVAVIAVLGEAMKGQPGILARLFSIVAERQVSVIAVSQGASELTICFAVPSSAAHEVVRSIHSELCAREAYVSIHACVAGVRQREVWSS